MKTTNFNLADSIIFEDQNLIVLNKPSGMLTIPDGYDSSKVNLFQFLKSIYENIWVVHRIDKETSGLVLFAKNAKTHRSLSLQFQNREITKTYILLCHNSPAWIEKQINQPLRVSVGRKKRTAIDKKLGKSALTEFSVLNKFTDHAFLEASPKSGYTHQIRAHVCWAGYPIINDPLYTLPAEQNQSKHQDHNNYQYPITRLALHAFSIQFQHPETNQLLFIKTTIPDSFQKTFQYLKLQEK